MKRARRALGIAAGTLAAVGAAIAGAYGAGLHVNLTESLPPGLYRELDVAPAVGDLALACPPAGAATELARERGYFLRGLRCPGRLAPVLKTVAAGAGDHVVADRTGLRVNGRRIPCTSPLPRDSAGRPLAAALGSTVLADDQVWLAATYSPRSFDSRYHGPWPRASLRGRVVPVWTADDPRRACCGTAGRPPETLSRGRSYRRCAGTR